MENVEALVDVNGAAQLLAVSPSMVKKLARTGRLPVRKIGAAARYSPSDLERLALGKSAEDATAS